MKYKFTVTLTRERNYKYGYPRDPRGNRKRKIMKMWQCLEQPFMKSTLSRLPVTLLLCFSSSFFFVFEHMTTHRLCTITTLFPPFFFSRFYRLLTNLALLARFMVCRAYHAYNIGYTVIDIYICILYNVDIYIYVNDVSYL